MVIQYTVSNLIFILNSFVDFINALTKEFMQTSSSTLVFCVGSMISFLAYWVVVGVLVDFYWNWFKVMESYLTGVSDFNPTKALANMEILIIVVMSVTFIQGILRILQCKSIQGDESELAKN